MGLVGPRHLITVPEGHRESGGVLVVLLIVEGVKACDVVGTPVGIEATSGFAGVVVIVVTIAAVTGHPTLSLLCGQRWREELIWKWSVFSGRGRISRKSIMDGHH